MLSINCNGRLLAFTEPAVMGIINITPDSFYAGSRRNTIEQTISTATRMVEEGAAIIDIGGQSTRPGSTRIPAEEEYSRVVPVVSALSAALPSLIISIDTFYSSVAEGAVRAGASMVNDVSAGTIDPQLLPAVAGLKVPYVLMHMQGSPQTMHHHPSYKNVVTEVFDFLNFKIAELHGMGIHDIIIDPGFGFGKTSAHNFTLLQQLSFFHQLQQPLLVGISRKGTIYKTLNITAAEALNGTTVLNTIALQHGAHILRVHDVKEAAEAVKLVAALKK